MRSFYLVFLLIFLFGQPGFSQKKFEVILKPNSKDGKDAMISSLYDNVSLGARSLLNTYAWTVKGQINITRALIDFDFGCIPPNAKILKARMTLYYTPEVEFPQMHFHSGDPKLIVRRITEPWEEEKVTWATMPQIDESKEVESVMIFSDSGNVVLKLKDLLEDFIKYPKDSHGFMIQLEDEDPYYNLTLASSDCKDARRHPKLEIVYEIPEKDCVALQGNPKCVFDTEIVSNIPYGNFSAKKEIQLKPAGEGKSLGLFQADLTWMEEKIHSFSTKIKLQGTNTGSLKDSVKVMAISEKWKDYRVNWNNKPRIDSGLIIKTSVQDLFTKGVEVKNIIQFSRLNYGVMIEPLDDNDGEVHYYSLENTDSNRTPVFELCYSPLSSKNLRKILKTYYNPGDESIVFSLDMFGIDKVEFFNLNGDLVYEEDSIFYMEEKFERENWSNGAHIAKIYVTNMGPIYTKIIH